MLKQAIVMLMSAVVALPAVCEQKLEQAGKSVSDYATVQTVKMMPGPYSAAQKAMRASVTMEAGIFGFYSQVGSGTLIKDPKLGEGILTAAHVAGVKILPFSGAGFSPTWRACWLVEQRQCIYLGDYIMNSDNSDDDDWAFFPVKSRPKEMRSVSMREELLAPGTPVVQVGVPMGQPWVNSGTIAWINHLEDEPVYAIAGFAYPGSSGGGVFDYSGRLVAITVAISLHDWFGDDPREMENQVWAVPARNVLGN